MKIATLGIIVQDDKILLGEKKKGEIGTGMLSGPGGKLDPGETLETCLIRETREELEIELDPASLELVSVIDFYAAEEIDFRVHIYRAKILSGEIHETADMIPAWYPINEARMSDISCPTLISTNLEKSFTVAARDEYHASTTRVRSCSLRRLKMSKGKVTVAEAMRVRAAKWFNEKGYSAHLIYTGSDTEMIKITAIRQKQQWRFLWWTGHSEQKLHIGDLWIECSIIGAHRDNWVFQMYGREDFNILRRLIKDLAEELKVDIHVRLEEEEPRLEDDDCYPY